VIDGVATLNKSVVATSVRARRRSFTHVFCRRWAQTTPRYPTSC
jgi:hypothetical protein